jgi:hypothetical protein
MRLRSFAGLALVTIVFSVQAQELREPARRNPPHSRFLQAAGEQRDSVTATDGRDFLTVWSDSRSGARTSNIWHNGEGWATEIYMNLVRSDRTVLSPFGVHLSEAGLNCSPPAVVWTGSHYLVAWAYNDLHVGPAVAIVRIARDGTVLDPAPRKALDAPYGNLQVPKLAVNASGTVLVVARAHTTVALATVDRSGAASEALTIHDTMVEAAVSTGESFLLFSTASPRKLVSRRVDAHPLSVGEARVLASGFDGSSLEAASRGDEVLLAYDRYSAAATGVFTRVLRRDGTLSAEVQVSAPHDPDLPDRPPERLSLTAASDGFLLAWSTPAGVVDNPYVARSVSAQTVLPPRYVTTSDVVAARLSPEGRVNARFTLVAGGHSDELPSIASNGREIFVSWTEQTLHYPVNIKLAAAFSSGGLAGERLVLARSRERQQTPELAAGGDGYLLTWVEEPANDGMRAVYAQRVTRDGRMQGVPVLLSDGSRDSYGPKVAFNGEVFLVVWMEDASPRRVMGRRLTAGGTSLDDTARLITPGRIGSMPVVASNGRDFAVAWGSAFPEMRRQAQTAHVVRISSAFELGTPATVHPGENTIESELAIAASGLDYVMSWQADDSLASASVAAGDFSRRLDGFESLRDPVVSCNERQCLALASVRWEWTFRPFHPLFDVQPAADPAKVRYGVTPIVLTRDGDGHVAVWATYGATTTLTIRGRALTADGAAASEERELARSPRVTGLSAATLDGRLAVAYTHPGADGVARVAVRVVGLQ